MNFIFQEHIYSTVTTCAPNKTIYACDILNGKL